MLRISRLTVLQGLALLALAAWLATAGCGDDSRPVEDQPLQPVEGEPLQRVDHQALEEAAAELEGRSFRQFEPSVDGNPRRGVILDFRVGFGIWAQYAEGGFAIDEWEIRAASYRVESTVDGSGIALIPEGLTSEQEFPDRCSNCISATGVSVSVRDVFDRDEIAFRIEDPNNVLPSPFPVFTTWTRFSEDEIFH